MKYIRKVNKFIKESLRTLWSRFLEGLELDWILSDSREDLTEEIG